MEGTMRNQETRANVIEERDVTTRANILPAFIGRISFAAVVAGVAVALVFQVALNLLGISIGANAINPLTQQNPIDARLGVTAVIWIIVSSLISLFVGGYVASRMAGTVDREDGVLHGVSTWAITTIISLMFLSSSVGSVLGTASNVLSQGLNLAGSAAADLSPAVADALNLQNIRLDGIKQQAQGILSAAAPADQTITSTTPDNSANGTDNTTATDANNTTANNANAQETPQQRELDLDITRLLTSTATGDDLTASRDTVTNFLVQQGGMTADQAQQTVAKWESDFQQVRTQAEATARQVGQTIADTVAALSGVVFMMMVVTLAGAVFGGLFGAHSTSTVTVNRVTTARKTT